MGKGYKQDQLKLLGFVHLCFEPWLPWAPWWYSNLTGLINYNH